MKNFFTIVFIVLCALFSACDFSDQKSRRAFTKMKSDLSLDYSSYFQLLRKQRVEELILRRQHLIDARDHLSNLLGEDLSFDLHPRVNFRDLLLFGSLRENYIITEFLISNIWVIDDLELPSFPYLCVDDSDHSLYRAALQFHSSKTQKSSQ